MSQTENASFPMANLWDRNPNHLWKGTAVASQTLTIDLGAARTVDTILLGNHNFFSALGGGAGTLVIQCKLNSGDAWTAWATLTFTASGDLEVEAGSVSMRYWNFSFGNASILPQIGNISLGARIELTQPYDSQNEHGETFNTNSRRSVNATPYASQLYPGIETWRRAWTTLAGANNTLLLKLSNSVRGKFMPFYMIDVDGTTLRLVYLNTDANITRQKAYGQYDVPQIELEAFLTNTINLS